MQNTLFKNFEINPFESDHFEWGRRTFHKHVKMFPPLGKNTGITKKLHDRIVHVFHG